MDKYFNIAIEKIQDLVKIESVESEAVTSMPFGENVAKALNYSLKLCEELGFKCVNLDGYIGYSDIGEGEMFGILGHIDVVPLGEDWDYKQGEIHNGTLYGRGVMDDKGPMILCLYALKQLLDEGYNINKKVRFIWGADEESGWKCIDYYNSKEKMPNVGFSPDADFPVIFAEKGIVHYDVKIKLSNLYILNVKGGERVNMVADKCVLMLSKAHLENNIFEKYKDTLHIEVKDNYVIFTAKGISAHGSHPEIGDNAIWKIINLLSDLDENCKILKKLTDYTGKGVNLNLEDNVSGNLTINIGTIKMEGKYITLELDIRYPVTFKEDYVFSILKNELPKCEITETMKHNALYVEKDNGLIVKLLNAYKKVTGENAQPIAIGGGTYARSLPLGVAFGPVLPNKKSSIHEKNESASLTDLETAYKIYYEAIKSLCFEN